MINKNFYPTPTSLASDMAHRISKDAKYILEPSAGSGAVLDALRRRFEISDKGLTFYGGRPDQHLYAIEIDQDLVATLKGKAYDVIGYDFLAFEPENFFDAIVMNPPFDNGEDHLLHALEILRGGEIVCLLNKETLANPFSAKRKLLAQKLEELGAEIKDMGKPFAKADRRTDVEVAMVYVRKESVAEDGFEYWSELSREAGEDGEGGVSYELTRHDQIEAMVSSYAEVQRNVLTGCKHLQRAFYFARGVADIGELEKLIDPISNLEHPESAYRMAVNGFMDRFRRDAWKSIFERTGADKLMSRTVREKFSDELERGSSIAFTAENIKAVVANLYDDAPRIIRDSVVDVFEHLCQFDAKNKVHVEGWKTNSAYKVNRRVIIPWAIERWLDAFHIRHGYNGADVLNDLDRVLASFTGKKDARGVVDTLMSKFKAMDDQTPPTSYWCESEFFFIRFYKKGTLHLTWTDEALWARFNLEAARGRAWIGDDAKSADEYTKRLRIGAA